MEPRFWRQRWANKEEVRRQYAATYELTLIATTEVPGGLKGNVSAKENVWLLKRP